MTVPNSKLSQGKPECRPAYSFIDNYSDSHKFSALSSLTFAGVFTLVEIVVPTFFDEACLSGSIISKCFEKARILEEEDAKNRLEEMALKERGGKCSPQKELQFVTDEISQAWA